MITLQEKIIFIIKKLLKNMNFEIKEICNIKNVVVVCLVTKNFLTKNKIITI